MNDQELKRRVSKREKIWNAAIKISAILSHRRFEDSISAKEASELALSILNVLNDNAKEGDNDE